MVDSCGRSSSWRFYFWDERARTSLRLSLKYYDVVYTSHAFVRVFYAARIKNARAVLCLEFILSLFLFVFTHVAPPPRSHSTLLKQYNSKKIANGAFARIPARYLHLFKFLFLISSPTKFWVSPVFSLRCASKRTDWRRSIAGIAYIL
jgi:hypothetical protein